jgi:apolipoprotein N-acyltransferase
VIGFFRCRPYLQFFSKILAMAAITTAIVTNDGFCSAAMVGPPHLDPSATMILPSTIFVRMPPPSPFVKLGAMQDAIATGAAVKSSWITRITSQARSEAPTLTELAVAVASAVLLILSFPNFDFHFLAWLALGPLLFVVARRPAPIRACLLGWVAGSLFFYVSCSWLTYSMIHYGDLSPWLAYLLLVPGALLVGAFPALFALLTSIVIRRWGHTAILLAPFFWATSEWARLGITGQLWNAIGYSQAQAFHGLLIQTARWGGVYEVGFLILTVNAAVVLGVMHKRLRAIALLLIVMVGLVLALSARLRGTPNSGAEPYLRVVAVQPNVPMTLVKSADETRQLLERHLSMSQEALKTLPNDGRPRLVVWPESPMNFTYAADKTFQDLVGNFTRENHTYLLFNSLEPAPNEGGYNSALLINEEGRLISQYDKIRLMPFGEYVPLPQWLGGSLISGLVGEFTPGDKYTLMPIGNHRVGVFICIESAYPSITRTLTSEGADVLINISNDGYLGPTAVMRQHLANTIFRAVENSRPLLRVTNTGLSAEISADGLVTDTTRGFQPAVRSWAVGPAVSDDTFYTKHGDWFVALCTLITAVSLAATFYRRRRSFTDVR